MKWVVLAFGCFTYGLFVWTALYGLRVEDSGARWGKKVVALGGPAAILYYLLRILAHDSLSLAAGILALTALSVSAGLLLWALRQTEGCKLDFAFSERTPGALYIDGPFAIVRHPLYVSYTLGWLGGWVADGTWLGGVPVVVLGCVYLTAGYSEERRLMASALGREYECYRARVGALFPRLFRRSGRS